MNTTVVTSINSYYASAIRNTLSSFNNMRDAVVVIPYQAIISKTPHMSSEDRWCFTNRSVNKKNLLHHIRKPLVQYYLSKLLILLNPSVYERLSRVELLSKY